MEEKLNTTKILGINITADSKEKVLEYITRRLENKDEKFFIVTPNPEIMVYASKHPDFKAVLNEASFSLPDGVGVVWASKILNKGIKGRITGVDMVNLLCGQLSTRIETAGFLGGISGVADEAAKCLQKMHPGLKVSFVGEEWDEKKIKGEKIDLLFVGFGFPKQEKWIHDNLKKIPVTAAMGVGGSFDFISGRIPRAPRLIRRAGLEWLFRLILQPWRIKRQLALIEFVWLVLKEAIVKRGTN